MEVHRKKWGLLSGRLVDDRMALLSHFSDVTFYRVEYIDWRVVCSASGKLAERRRDKAVSNPQRV